MASLISWVVLLSILFAVAGGLWFKSLQGTAGGVVVGIVVAIIVWVKNLAYIFHPDSFLNYEATTPTIAPADDGKVVLSLVVVDDKGNRISKEIHGLTLDEWRQLGIGTVKNGYEFSSRKLQAIFTPASRGATIYEIVRPLLEDKYIGILIPSGSNGVAVSQGRGEKFFEQLAKGDYEILRILNNPPSPTKSLDMV